MYHPDIGGVETVTKQYAEWLSSENHKVTVLTTSSKSNFKIETKMIFQNRKLKELQNLKFSQHNSLDFLEMKLSYVL